MGGHRGTDQNGDADDHEHEWSDEAEVVELERPRPGGLEEKGHSETGEQDPGDEAAGVEDPLGLTIDGFAGGWGRSLRHLD